jgi:hypothetical protein
MAGASLFIYLLQLPVAISVAYLGFPVKEMPALHVLSILVVGYLFWRCWEFLWTRFGRESSQEPL